MTLKPKQNKKKKRGTILNPHKVTDKAYRKRYASAEPVLIGTDTEPYYHRAAFVTSKKHRALETGEMVIAATAAAEYAAYLKRMGFKVKVLEQDKAWHVFRQRDISDLIHQSRILS